jgi:hypothetical protein
MGHYKVFTLINFSRRGVEYTVRCPQERETIILPTCTLHNFIYENILITKGCFLIYLANVEHCDEQSKTYKTGRDYMNILKSVIVEGALMVVSLVVEKSKF